jgi:hypothetical protein
MNLRSIQILLGHAKLETLLAYGRHRGTFHDQPLELLDPLDIVKTASTFLAER